MVMVTNHLVPYGIMAICVILQLLLLRHTNDNGSSNGVMAQTTVMQPIIAYAVESVGETSWYTGSGRAEVASVVDGARYNTTFGQLAGIVCVTYEDSCYVVDKVFIMMMLRTH
jgi:hypothetical protein